jgi:CO/xanthine dehydrogenase FAD-binding subunit
MLSFGSFSWSKPDTLEEARQLLSEKGATLIAGGTDLMPLLRYGLVSPSRLVSLEDIPDLHEISWQEDQLFIGAAVTLTQLTDDSVLAKALPALIKAARRVASPQIRNIATVGGNIFQNRRCIYFNQTSTWRDGLEPCLKLGGGRCYQAPRALECGALYHSDLAPVLIALQAKAVFHTEGGRSVIPLWEALQRMSDLPGRLAEYEQAICIGFSIPGTMFGALCNFFKYSIRGAIDFPLVNLACSYLPGSIERASMVAVTAGAINSQLVRLEKTANIVLAFLADDTGDPCTVEEQAGEELREKSALIKESGVSAVVRRKIIALAAKELVATVSFWRQSLRPGACGKEIE